MVTGDSFDLIDNDQESTTITLSYGEAKIAQDADPTDVTVTATLEWQATLVQRTCRFTLLIDDALPRLDGYSDYAMRITERTGLPITILKGSPTGKVRY